MTIILLLKVGFPIAIPLRGIACAELRGIVRGLQGSQNPLGLETLVKGIKEKSRPKLKYGLR